MAIAKIEGTLVFVQLDTPKPCFVAEKGSEWKASIVVDEDFADTWDAEYPKQPAKQIKTAEFETVYKIPAPFPEQRKQYIITLRKNTKLGNGNEVPEQYHPQVLVKANGALQNITKTKLVANGSKGAISVEHYDGKMGSFARLKNVLVTDLIEYVKEASAGGQAGSEFGEVVAESKPEPKHTPAKAAPKAKEPVSKFDDMDDDIPF